MDALCSRETWMQREDWGDDAHQGWHDDGIHPAFYCFGGKFMFAVDFVSIMLQSHTCGIR